MVSRGKGYAPITGPTTANTGDSVIAFSGGHAKVIYPDGCTVDVNDEGTVFVVSDDFALQSTSCFAVDERKSPCRQVCGGRGDRRRGNRRHTPQRRRRRQQWGRR